MPATATQPSERLLNRLATDLDRAFPDLVRSLQNDVFSGLVRLASTREDAEELTQETFLRAYRALAGYNADRVRALRLRGWIWTIALNLARNEARSIARRPRSVAVDPTALPPAPTPSPEDLALAAEAEMRWGEALANLSLPVRRAIVLKHVVGLSYPEVADVLARPIGTVKADVHRGLARLRADLDNQPGGPR